ncbi:MAG TPA: glycosyltransferase family 2 protein [Candidatus Bathyarchaeia archaeon]|nr:glycosyltransferase family 2 protein [Candidatus Bathyarchaeia archaeon]
MSNEQKSDKPELSVIIVSYKNPTLLRLCIQSLQKNILSKDYEIIVLDNATEESTEMLMREEFPDIKFFPHAKNLFYSKVVNEGIKNAKGKYLLILNYDIIVEKRSVDILLEQIKKDPKVGLIGPRLLNFDGSPQSSCFRFYTPTTILYRRTFIGKLGFSKKKINQFLLRDKNLEKPTEVDWVMGSALMTSRKALEKVGSMDELYLYYFEDVDWCRRFWENGYKVIYYPFARMFHYHGKQSASVNPLKAVLFNKLAREHIKSALKYFWKYHGKPNPHKI